MFTQSFCIIVGSQRFLDVSKDDWKGLKVEWLGLPTFDVTDDLRSFLSFTEIDEPTGQIVWIPVLNELQGREEDTYDKRVNVSNRKIGGFLPINGTHGGVTDAISWRYLVKFLLLSIVISQAPNCAINRGLTCSHVLFRRRIGGVLRPEVMAIILEKLFNVRHR